MSRLIPPRSTAVESGSAGPPGQRDKHITAIAKDGRHKWQAATGYGKRALVDTASGDTRLQSDDACPECCRTRNPKSV